MQVGEPLEAVVAAVHHETRAVHKRRVVVARRRRGTGRPRDRPLVSLRVKHMQVVQSGLAVPAPKYEQFASNEIAAVRCSRTRNIVGFQVRPAITAGITDPERFPKLAEYTHGYFNLGWYQPIGDEKREEPGAADAGELAAAPPAKTTGPVIPPMSETGSATEVSMMPQQSALRSHSFKGEIDRLPIPDSGSEHCAKVSKNMSRSNNK